MTARLFVVTAALLALGAPHEAPEFKPVPGLSRLRVMDARTADTFRLGLAKSATVRELVSGIEAGRDYVYVGLDDDLPRHLSGRMTIMGVGGQQRYLRVSLARDLSPPDAVATLAHELQHVREVQAHPEVRDAASLAALYRRIGHQNNQPGRSGWDTADAQRIGRAVRTEMAPSLLAAKAR